MMNDEISIDPWGSSQSTDYSRIIDKFGLSSMDNVSIDSPSRLHRRGVVFAHRDLDIVLEEKRKGNSFGVLTGLMPSENAFGALYGHRPSQVVPGTGRRCHNSSSRP